MTASASARGVASAAATVPLLVDRDVFVDVLSRQHPDPALVHAFRARVQQHAVFLCGPVRQALLRRARDARQFARLQWILAGFPDLTLTSTDFSAAALLAFRPQPPDPQRALLWALAMRCGALIWSRDPAWQRFRTVADCPLLSQD